ncbi:hypothetical protein J5690_03740 [bacterium]|nr:hypothetical protein [bacterium]
MPETMTNFMKVFFVLATLFFVFTVCGEGAPCDYEKQVLTWLAFLSRP